ncbi:MAG TPA: lipoyl(octanoyl) transferase LipB, partial [Myxococcota bacterium]|nr:lipoyl(octanoyl) transferase LipB [Myxococcota bacterium]
MLDWSWKGSVDYGIALEAQREQRQRRLAGEVGDELWLLEHPAVITVGRRFVAPMWLPPEIPLFRTERGGLATCHEPGQLVGYLIADASACGPKKLVEAIEAGLIGWLEEQSVEATRRAGYPGVWVGLAKIAAVGLHLERGGTLHGFALNLTNSLEGFRWIQPCGIPDAQVTSLARLRGSAPSPDAAAEGVAKRMVVALQDVLDDG